MLVTKLFRDNLLDGFVNAEVETSSYCVSQGMQVITGIETKESVAINDLFECLKSANPWHSSQVRVTNGIWRCLRTMRDQDRCLDNIFRKFEGT